MEFGPVEKAIETTSGYIRRLKSDHEKRALFQQLNPLILPYAKLLIHSLDALATYGNPDMPVTCAIETASVCNRSCLYCTVATAEFRQSRINTFMSEGLFKEIVEQLAQVKLAGRKKGYPGALFLNCFGEPLLDKKIMSRVAYARRRLPEARIGIFTNGDFLNKDKLNGLVLAGAAEVVATIHDPADFNQELLGLENPHFRIQPPLVYLSNRAGKAPTIISRDRLIAPEKICVSPTFSFYVSTDGNVALCCNDSLVEASMGTIGSSSEGNIWTLWGKQRWVDARRNLRRGNFERTPDICRRCRQPSVGKI